jgi:LPS export ABC transporter permease LptG
MIVRRITRYLGAELRPPMLLGLLLWTFVLLMNHFFFVAERALAKNLDLAVTARLFFVGVPAILVLTIPMAVLLGSLVAIGRLSADHEWEALQSAGRGPWTLLGPLVIHGLLATLVSFYIFSELTPRASYVRRELQAQVLFSSSLANDLKPRVFYTELQNTVLFVDDIGAGAQARLSGVLLVRHDPKGSTYDVILAAAGDLYPASDGSGTLLFDLYDGVIHHFDPADPSSYLVSNFEHLREPFAPPEYLKSLRDPPQRVVPDMRFGELLDEFKTARTELAKAEARTTATDLRVRNQDLFLPRHRERMSAVELNSRLALPCASLVLSALALPLGIRRARSGKGAGFALSLLVIVVYWALFTFTRDQALAGRLPASLGPWIANVALVIWAAFGLFRMRRPRDFDTGPLESIRRLISRGVQLLRRKPASGEPATPAGVDALEGLGGTSTRFVRRVDQYVASTYLRLLVLALCAAYMIFALVELKKLSDGMLRTHAPVTLLLSYFPYFLPSVLPLVFPIACLVAAVVGFSVLARNGELTALLAGGHSLRRSTMPVLVVTAVLCGVVYLVQDTIGPVASRRAHEIEDQLLGRAPKTYGMPPGGRWSFGAEGRSLYHYRVADNDQHTFQSFTAFAIDRTVPRILDQRYAERAHWLGGRDWDLEGGWYRSFPRDGTPGEYRLFTGIEKVVLDGPTELTSQQLSAGFRNDVSEQMSFIDLREEIDDLERGGYDTTRMRVALHGKVARAVAPVVMVLLGLPFAFRIGRRGALYGIGVALILVIVYWAAFAVFNALGLETVLTPWIAAWTPNVVFGLIGMYLMLFVRT